MPDITTGNISIAGLADLERNLLDFPDRVAKKILGGAIRAGAVVIQKEARSLAPVSPGPHKVGKGTKSVLVQPGHLKKNIKVRLAPRKSREVPITYWVYVSKKAWYWRFPEFGTSKAGARPFLRPAFDTMKEKATERIREYMAARIEKEAAKQ